LLAAELELTTRCNEKKAIVMRMRDQGDAGALPYLRRLEATPKRGCGMVRMSDCLGCLRRELSDTLDALPRE
jgi:hypothetical protein